MNDWLNNLAYFLIGAMLMSAVLGLGIAAVVPGMDRWNRRFFMVFFSILALGVCAFLADLIVYDNPRLVLAERISAGLQYLLTSVMAPMLTLYLLHCCGESWRSSALFAASFALWIAYLLLLVIAQFTTFFYYVTPDNQFYYGPWHSLLIAPLVVIMILNLIGVIRRRDKLSPKLFFALLVYLLPMTLALLTQMFYYDALLIILGISLCLFSMFAIIMLDQIEQYMRQQREITHQRASIMVLQMRPHFIHNTMTSIYYLCKQDPDLAQRVTLDFNTYLRRNFTAIASEEPIPFPEELEHTRAYLAVEQAQFEDNLFVDYDTPHTRFRLPPLTLQPIVENAVKHGMDPDSDPLRISIRTRQTPSGSEITVEDNGSGYEPAADKEPHIALANIRQRLEMMCGGKMTITPREDGGTVVRVTIP